jgi:tetratricopeptide (TPR) repeat protein
MDSTHLLNNISTAQQLKAQGNQLVSEQNYKLAVKQYVKIFLYIRGIKPPPMAQFLEQSIPMEHHPLSAELEQEIHALELSANLNLALCFLKLKDYDKVIKFAGDALKVDPENYKAMYRRGCALAEKRLLDEAREDLELVLSKGSREMHAAVRKELDKVRALEKERDEATRKKFAGMFDRMDLSEE